MIYKNDGLTFSTEHEGGAIGGIETLGINWYHLHLRADSWFWFNIKMDGVKNQRIIFQVRDRTPEDERCCQYWVRRTKKNTPAKTHHPHYSYDGKMWYRVEHSELDHHESDLIRFSQKFSQNTVYMCYGIPYQVFTWENYKRKFLNHPDFNSEIVGYSRVNFPVEVVTITNQQSENYNKKIGYLLCREDQGETTGSLALEGMVNYLMADEQKQLREEFIIYIAPLVSIDGIMFGSPFSGGYGYMTNRWNEANPPEEIAVLRSFIEKKNAKGSTIAFAGKLHGSVSWDSTNYFDCTPESRGWSYLFANNETTAEAACKYLPENSKAMTMERTGERPEGRFERYVSENYDCDMIFATEIHADSEQEARECGTNIIKGIFE